MSLEASQDRAQLKGIIRNEDIAQINSDPIISFHSHRLCDIHTNTNSDRNPCSAANKHT
jgi:hypothetical protein